MISLSLFGRGRIGSLLMSLSMLLCTMHADLASAQTPTVFNTHNYMPADGAHYEGYSIAMSAFDYNTGTSLRENGYIAAGNRISLSGVHDSIHVLEIPVWDMPLPQVNWQFPDSAVGFNFGIAGYTDLRVVGITCANTHPTPTDTGNIAILVQARKMDENTHTIILVLDCRSFGTTPVIVKTIDLGSAAGHFYPQGITCPVNSTGLNYNRTVFICGYYLDGPQLRFPAEPTLSTPKEAFIGKVNLDNGDNLITYVNTAQEQRAAPFPMCGGSINDYDAALRIRWVHGIWLIVTGSGNASSATAWPGRPTWPVNTSASWVAEMDTATMTVLAQDYIGLSRVDDFISPCKKAGFDGVDVNIHHGGPHDYYLLQNRLDHFGWYMSHIDHTPVTISTPATGDNSFYYSDTSIHQKAMVLFPHGFGLGGVVTPADRMMIYGAMDNYNFSAGMESSYNTNPVGSGVVLGTSAIGANPSRYYHHISGPPPAAYVPDQPYWLNTDLSIWSNPDCAVPYQTGSSNFGGPDPDWLGMMGHHENTPAGSSSTNITPRFTQGDVDGDPMLIW